MKPDCILIRIGEMSLKSEQVNRKWSKILMDNIKYGLKGFDYKIEKKNRYFIYTNNIDKVSKILQRIFGITSISLCYVCKSNINNIKKKALEVAKNKIKKSQAFAISVKRIDFQDLSSQEIAIKVGDIIVNKLGLKVNLSNPDKTIFIEARNDKTYIYMEKINCAGGLPLGTSGKIGAIVNSKKALVATWLMMKRGCTIIFKGKQEFFDILKKWHIGKRMLKTEKFKNIKISTGKKINDSVFLDPTVAFSRDKLTRLYEYIVNN